MLGNDGNNDAVVYLSAAGPKVVVVVAVAVAGPRRVLSSTVTHGPFSCDYIQPLSDLTRKREVTLLVVARCR